MIVVLFVRTKSSADSISNTPPASGREAVAIRPFGLPVLKKNGSAEQRPEESSKAAEAAVSDVA